MPLLVQLLTLQRKNFLVTIRSPVPAATWENSDSMKEVTPMTIMERPGAPLPDRCSAFGNVGELIYSPEVEKEGQKGNWESVDPIGRWMLDTMYSEDTRDASMLLMLPDLYNVRKLSVAQPASMMPRKTVGAVGAGQVQQLLDRITKMAGMLESRTRPAHEMFSACNPSSAACRTFWTCFLRRATITMKPGEVGSCSTACGDIGMLSDKYSSEWSSTRPMILKVVQMAMTSAKNVATMPGCAKDSSNSWDNMLQFMEMPDAAMVATLEVMLQAIDVGGQCSDRRLHQTSAGVRNSSSSNSFDGASQPGVEPALISWLQSAVLSFNASWQMRAESLKHKSVNTNRSLAWYQRNPALAILNEAGQGGAMAVTKLIWEPHGLLEQALPKKKSLDQQMRRQRASRSRVLAAKPLFNNKTFLSTKEDTDSGAASRRLSNIDCYSLGTACECAAHPGSCAWHGWWDEDDDQHKKECMSLDDVDSRFEFAATTCWECPTQPGCTEAETWARMSQVLDLVTPAVRIFNSEEDMKDVITAEDYGGVTMVDGIPTSEEICFAIDMADAGCIDGGADCSYSLRLNGSITEGGRERGVSRTDLLEVLGTSGWADDMGEWNIAKNAWNEYEYGGFLRMQLAVDDFLLRPTAPDDEVMPKQWYHYIPFPRSVRSTWNSDVRQGFGGRPDVSTAYGTLGFVAFACIVLPFAVISRALREKEDQLRDGMRMMGLSDMAYYMSMYIWAVTWLTIPCAIMTIILQITPTKLCPGGVCELAIGDLFRHTDFFWIWLLFFLTCLANMSIGMILVPLVGRARTGRILAPAMMYFLTYVNFSDPSTSGAKTAVALVPGLGFLNAMKAWIQLEDAGIGVKADTLNVLINEYSISSSLFMLTIDIFLYFFIYWYADQTATYGSGHRPVYFLCTKEYWAECLGRTATSATSYDEFTDSAAGGAFEAPSAACKEMTKEGKTLEVRGLRKTFKAQGRTIAAVDGVDFSMYPGEIYVLLGHNGAGKTTSISCLTGLIRPTAGQAHLFGQPLWKVLQTTEGRKQIGICPQHNVLWRELTCLEHVTLFGAFRGLNRTVARQSGLDILSQCGLSEKANAKSGALSGGMKRKLCLALSLVGEPKLAFLDEPSSGMDPTARRDTWDLLRRQKEGRILVLTTHYMDEADVLGDRIGIMSKGQLQCLGSPIFLKQYYGCGYNLNFEFLEGAEKQKAVDFVQKEVGSAGEVKVMSEAGKELVLLVDFAASRVFPTLFAALDSQDTKANLSLNAWSIAVCHLEEVFLRVAAGGEGGVKHNADPNVIGRATEVNDAKPSLLASGEEAPAAEGDVTAVLNPSVPRQVAVMLKKRMRYTIRDPMLCFCQLFCPMVALAVILGVLMGFVQDQVKLDLSLDLYNEIAADEGAPQNVVPYGTVKSSLSSMPEELVAMNLINEAPKLELQPGTAPQCIPDYRDHADHMLSRCMPMTDSGQSSYSLAKYARSVGCELLATDDNHAASRYVAFLPVEADASGEANILLFANLSAVHIAPIATNLATNMLRKKAGKSGKVKVANHPLPITARERKAFFGGDGLLITLAILIPAFIFPFPTAFAAAYVIREKETRVKSQHFMSGVGMVTYWFASMLADYIIFFMAVLLVLIPSAIAGADAVTSPEVILSFFVFAAAQIPFGYLIGSLFNTAAGAQNFVLAFNMGVTFIFGTAGLILRLLNLCWMPSFTAGYGECTMGLQDWLDIILRLVPGVCLSEAMHVIGTVRTQLQIFPLAKRTPEWYAECQREVGFYERVHWACADSPLEFGAAGGPLLWMGLEAIAFIILILLIDFLQLHPRFRKSLHYVAPLAPKPEGWEDEDVLNEARNMESYDTAAVHCAGIRKVYGPVGVARCCSSMCSCSTCCGSLCKRDEVHAVKGVNFALTFGEVFGLLGTNGAGKSSVFNMIAGHISPTEGNIWVNGMDISTGPGSRAARRMTGYCPQENALLDLMTTREHLVFYSNLKGVPGGQIGSVADAKMEQLGLATHAKNYASNLSGGNKRKLMVACALIGDPNLILADEPSAGMDPVARRFMWGVIQNLASRRKRSSVLLSTHSMEECEALCNRSAIMVNGVFRCIGSNRRIRNVYGSGFELMIKVKPPTDEELSHALGVWNHPAEARIHSTWAITAAGENKFIAAAVSGPSSPFAEANSLVAPKVLAEWWLYTMRFQTLHAFVASQLSENVQLLEWHGGMAKYKLTTSKGLGQLFGQLEQHREALQITEYSLSATTLEQIFNSFARHQDDGEMKKSASKAIVGAPVLTRQVSGDDYQTHFVHLALETQNAAVSVAQSAEKLAEEPQESNENPAVSLAPAVEAAV